MQITEQTKKVSENRVHADLHGVARAGVLRIASMPAHALARLRCNGTFALVQRLLDWEKELQSIQMALEDALYAVVPKLAHDGALRSSALELRRDIHSQRTTKLNEMQVEAVAKCLPPEAACLLSQWWILRQDHRTTLESAEKLLEQERDDMRAAMQECLRDDSFRRALSLASPEFIRESERQRTSPGRPMASKYERTLLNYIFRACAKTSPFSTFILQCPFECVSSSHIEVPARILAVDRHTVSRLNRGITARVLAAVQRAAYRENWIPLVLNKSVRRTGDDRIQALCDRPTVLLGRPWREQRKASFRFNHAVLHLLLATEGEGPWIDWIRRYMARGIPFEKSCKFVEALVESDLLQYAATTDGYDPAPDATVLASMQKSASAEVQQASAGFGRMMKLASGFAQEEAAERVRQIEDLTREEKEILRILGSRPAEPLHDVIVEDSYGSGMSVSASIGLSSLIQELANQVSERIYLSPEYIRLRSAFVARYGEGGICTDLPSFLSDSADYVLDIFRETNPDEGTDNVKAESGVRLGVTAHFQLSSQAADHSELLLVVNRVYEGIGWLSARLACGQLPENLMMRSRLKEWIETTCVPREPVDFLINGDCNELQAHPRLTRRAFSWPGEPIRPPVDQFLDARRLIVCHNPETGMLELFDQDRRPIALVYLGSVLPTFTWGVPYLVCVLSQPYKIQRPAVSPPLDSNSNDVVHQPRVTAGNVVLRRASWWVRFSYLKRAWFARSGVSQLMDVVRDAETWAIPETFFSQRMLLPPKSSVIPSNVLDTGRKPMWVDRRNPFSLCLLEHMAAQSEWVVFTEALPSPEDSVAELEGQRHVSELQVEMLVRAV